MKESDIINKLATYPYRIQRYELMIPNVYIANDSEADFFAIRKSGLSDEFEIKVSRSDFLADKKKMVRFRDLRVDEYRGLNFRDQTTHPNKKPKYQALIDGDLPVNYFWYVVTEGVADVSEIPDFAGLIVVPDNGRMVIKRRAVKLRKDKMSYEDRYKIARKSNYRYWRLRDGCVVDDQNP